MKGAVYDFETDSYTLPDETQLAVYDFETDSYTLPDGTQLSADAYVKKLSTIIEEYGQRKIEELVRRNVRPYRQQHVLGALDSAGALSKEYTFIPKTPIFRCAWCRIDFTEDQTTEKTCKLCNTCHADLFDRVSRAPEVAVAVATALKLLPPEEHHTLKPKMVHPFHNDR